MSLELQTAPTGQQLTGAPGLGAFPLSTNSTDDTQRAELLSVAVQSADVFATIYVRLAANLANANGGGPYIELGALADVTGINLACCRCIVPRGWSLFVVGTGPVLAPKYAVVDWHNVTLEPRA